MKKIKMLIDVLLFMITILLMDINHTGRFNHEVLGIFLTLLLIIHITLNIKWIIKITKNFKKIKKKTKALYIIDISIFIIYFAAILLGIMMSSIFDFKLNNLLRLTLGHHTLGRLSLVFMLIHLGLHLQPLINKITKDETLRMIIYIIYSAITILVCIYLFYTLTTSYIWISLI